MNIKGFFSTIKPSSIPLLEFRYYNLLKVVCLLALLSHVGFLILFYFLEITELVFIQILSIGIFIFCIYINEKRKYFLAATIGIIEVSAHQALCVHFIGVDSRFYLLLALCAMLPFLLPKGNSILKIILLLISVFSFTAIPYIIGITSPVYMLEPKVLKSIGIAVILITGSFLGVFGIYFANAISHTEDLLKLERKKSDDLLKNMLPESISYRLKNDTKIIADKFESVSVLFADIVGFTQLTSRLSPEELVFHLNEIFSAFDNLVVKHNLEKIKTIGDAYMVASGLPEVDPNHAQKMAAFALDIREYITNRTSLSREKLDIRIGIHAGSVIAGVIGVKKITYDIWGGTVNVANRMETYGLPNEINVSETFKKLVEDEFQFEKLNPVDVKGIGMMQTYILREK